jgi:hypothetical protein
MPACRARSAPARSLARAKAIQRRHAKRSDFEEARLIGSHLGDHTARRYIDHDKGSRRGEARIVGVAPAGIATSIGLSRNIENIPDTGLKFLAPTSRIATVLRGDAARHRLRGRGRCEQAHRRSWRSASPCLHPCEPAAQWAGLLSPRLAAFAVRRVTPMWSVVTHRASSVRKRECKIVTQGGDHANRCSEWGREYSEWSSV